MFGNNGRIDTHTMAIRLKIGQTAQSQTQFIRHSVITWRRHVKGKGKSLYSP